MKSPENNHRTLAAFSTIPDRRAHSLIILGISLLSPNQFPVLSRRTLIGNVTVTGGTVQVGQSPDPLHIAGNLNQNGGHLLFEIDPNGTGGFMESTLVFDLGASIGIANTNITFDFLNGADPDTFFHDGLFNLETFFKVSNGDPFGQDFSYSKRIPTYSMLPARPSQGSIPSPVH